MAGERRNNYKWKAPAPKPQLPFKETVSLGQSESSGTGTCGLVRVQGCWKGNTGLFSEEETGTLACRPLGGDWKGRKGTCLCCILQILSS